MSLIFEGAQQCGVYAYTHAIDCGKRLELPNRLMMGHAVEKVRGGSLPLGNSV